MSSAQRGFPKNPTPDDLAGIPICKEEVTPAAGSRGAHRVNIHRRSRKDRGAISPLPSANLPTADELAGSRSLRKAERT